MRIFVGTVNIAGQLEDYRYGFEALGHDVSVGFIDSSPKFSYKTERFFDISNKFQQWTHVVKKIKYHKILYPKEINSLISLYSFIKKYDIFLFQWPGYSLTSACLEYPFIKLLRKKIIQICNGDDTRYWQAFLQQYGVDLSKCGESYLNDSIFRPFNNLRTAEMYCDLVVSRPSHAGLAILPYMHFFYPVDLRCFSPFFPRRTKPVIVHGPSHRGVKGTEFILEALNRLKSEGVEFELRLLEGISNKEVISELSNADIAIDQILLADYGKFSIEAAASGCAVAVCDDPNNQPIPSCRPFCSIDSNNLEMKLRKLIENTDYRNEIAIRCHGYAHKYHDAVDVCSNLLSALQNPQKICSQFYKPTFYLDRFKYDEQNNPHIRALDSVVKRRASKIEKKIWGK